MARRNDQFQTIQVSGAMLPVDILLMIVSREPGVGGLTPDSYHLPSGTKINEAIAQSWSVVQAHWKTFSAARAELAEDDFGTSLTNERWLLPLFKELEYGRLTSVEGPEIDGKLYPIRRFYNNTPIHLIGCNLPLDRRTKGASGAATSSPHSMVQEYLNRSDDHLWAFLSNGLQLRILRDNVSLSRQAFVEFDLEAMMEGEVYADFALLWLLCHQSRVEAEKQDDCWLEQWCKLARESGTRVLNDLRTGVQNAIEALGRGFIAHPRNDRLREKLQETGELSKDDYYRQLLRIVYRLLFLFVAEDRVLLHPPKGEPSACELYDDHYSTRRLREMSERLRGSKHADLWHSLSLVFDSLGKAEGCDELGLVGLGSFLWSNDSTADLLGPHQSAAKTLSPAKAPQETTDLTNQTLLAAETKSDYLIGGDECDTVLISNDDLLTAIRALAFVEKDKILRSVDYRNLGSEELGSVYEWLLEFHPVMNIAAKTFELDVAAGNEKKTTGSYYTPDSLVQCLLDSALEPVVAERIKGKKGQEAETAILEMTVCDPACGSGHFLIAAAHRLARHLGRIRTGESEPSPADYQKALRDVIGRCIYGVDINPMAVELCKVSLWMEAIDPGRPLSFLDHHIQCGNSLLGTTPALLAKGIPNDAFKAIEGDDKEVVKDLKAQNKNELRDREKGQGQLDFDTSDGPANFSNQFSLLSNIGDDFLADVAEMERYYGELVGGDDYQNARLLADAWCSTFVWKKDDSELGKLCPTENDFRKIEENPSSISLEIKSEVHRLTQRYQFFHWHLAFPDVFTLPEDGAAENEQTGWSSGFDVVLGNPPWERLKLQEKEWFAARRPDIANAASANQRNRLVAKLKDDDPAVYIDLLAARRASEGTRHFVRDAQVYPLCGHGDVNTYALFAELAYSCVGQFGRVGIIVPPEILTGITTRRFFHETLELNHVISFFVFENEEHIFPGVDHRVMFSLLTLERCNRVDLDADCFFFARNTDHLKDDARHFMLNAVNVAKLNPVTKTCPIFRRRADMVINLAIYNRFPVTSTNISSDDGWNAFYMRLVHMGDHAADIRISLEERETHFNVPLYESKMIVGYDHRFNTFEGCDDKRIRDGRARPVLLEEKQQPHTAITPRYFVSASLASDLFNKYDAHSGNYLIVWRDITYVTNERTAISSVIPKVPASVTCPALGLPDRDSGPIIVGTFNSFVFDYLVRQKVGGNHLNWTVLTQIPLIPPNAFRQRDTEFVTRRVLELTFTSWDLEAFALDCGYEGPPFCWDEERRFLLRCELDAACFHLYLGSADEWGADSEELKKMFPTPRDAVDYIMETFPIVKKKDIKRTAILNDAGEVTTEGTYITKDTILSIYDEMQQAIDSGQPYQTRLDPPPGPPTDADGNFIPMDQWDEANWPTHIHQPREVSVE